jgi:predicted acylesterase/phospholipase RssA
MSRIRGGRRPGLKRVGSGASLLALVIATGAACHTTDIVRGYNTGSHGTIGDPSLTPKDSAARLLARMIVDEMSGSYFEGGPSLAPWFATAGTGFPGYVTASVEPADAGVEARTYKIAHFGAAGTHGRFDDVQKMVRSKSQSEGAPWALGAGFSQATSCQSGVVSGGGKAAADSIRFEVSLSRAVQRAKAWYSEGLIDDASLAAGALAGFEQVTRYLNNRRFHRDASRPNIGIVLSGGASNGMYTAGAAWALLNMIDGCLSSPSICKIDPRFRLISGTSAGSMVAVVVDMFNAAWEDGSGNLLVGRPGAGQTVIKQLTQWFTCLPAQQLYCVDSDSSLSILSNRVGLVNFDGARWLLGQDVKNEVLTDTSELLLNTVDFQSGALLAESDQNPADTAGVCDVVKHALSSIPEPFVANPIRDAADAGAVPYGFYLDGGVRSVVPMIPLIRRGADKVLVVSSSPSVVEGSTPPQQALDVLQRFIDITVGANGEEGIELGSEFAEVQAAREQQVCSDHCTPAGGDNDFCKKFCAGAFQQACAGAEAPREPPEFPTAAIYRSEARTPPAAGYSFNPRESLPLFLAGISAVRERCAELASFLGVPTDAALPWCNAPVPTSAECDDPSVQWPLPKLKYSNKQPSKNPPETVRSCDPSLWTANPPVCP